MVAFAVPLPPKELARRAHLRYTCCDDEGLHRVPRGRHFEYVRQDGSRVRDPAVLTRIQALGIPPAWTDVWICADERGHLQATGRDVRGRKQYIYHERWQAHASRTKFTKLRAFGESLPLIRKQAGRHLALPALNRKKVIASVVTLLDRTLIRVGNEEYARANGSYGLTTLRDQHAEINGQRLHLRFKAKSGKLRDIEFHDRRLARIVRQCQELPGQQLFQYEDERGMLRRVESADVNRYLQATTGRPFTAKDFRTWKATALMLEILHQVPDIPLSPTAAKRTVNVALRGVAEALGNTVTVCRKYYVHPQLVELFMEGKLARACGRTMPRAGGGLSAYERLLLKLLRRLERRKTRPQLALARH